MKRKTLPPIEGRTFVIADLHGAYERLLQLMEHVNFDKTKDRMVSVGDLVDRGPQNLECLSLLYEPWFHCVRSNHGDLMYDYFKDGIYGPWWAPNGGAWGLHFKGDTSDDAMIVRDLVDKDHALPFMLTVELSANKKFHVIHAELHSIMQITDEDLDNEEIFDEIAFEQSQDGDYITWGRGIFGNLYGAVLDERKIRKHKHLVELHKLDVMFNDKLSHIYSGHTVVRAPVRIGGQTNLDTRAFGSMSENDPDWCGLTMTEPATDKFWTAFRDGVKEVNVVDFNNIQTEDGDERL